MNDQEMLIRFEAEMRQRFRMTCNEFQEGLEPSFDNEANSETALEMQTHIEQCLTREGLFSGCLAVRRCQQNPTFVIARQPICHIGFTGLY